VTVVRFDAVVLARFGMVETDGIHQVMGFVMLEFAKDRVVGVDTQDNRCHHMSGMERLAY
jgi:hypothetical protein